MLVAMIRPSAPAALLLAPLALLAACGRQTRTLEVTSTPPGAIVWVNDVELGRTPVETDFLHYGTYDVRLRLEGFEPVVTSRDADAPLGEVPPFDLFAAAVPGDRVTRIAWHFDLVPLAERTDPALAERQLLERARGFRALAAPPAAPVPPEAPTTGASNTPREPAAPAGR